MKILLIQSWLGREQHPVLPLGLASIAASLRSHNVRIEDLNLSELPMESLKEILAEYKPETIGFSLRNADTTSFSDRFSYVEAFMKQIEITATVLPEAHRLVGGAGFSIFADQIMASSTFIDCGVTGHAESIVDELVRKRATGLYKAGSGDFVSPGFDLLEMNRYIPFQKNLAVGVEVNRGCNLSCKYCSYPVVSGTSVIERPLESIRKDIERLTGKGAGHLFLIAPILNNRRERGEEVAGLIESISSSITWEAYHSPVNFDRDYASRICNSGCTSVSFSPDGGTTEQMHRMGKSYGTGKMESAIEAAVSSGLGVSLNIFPWDPEGGIRNMLASFRNAAKWGRLAGNALTRLRFSFIRRLPETPYAPAHVSLNRRVAATEFVKPSPVGMIVFRALNEIYEKNLRTL